MIVGNPKIKITKTDVARWLSVQREQFPELAKRWEAYMSSCSRARRDGTNQFGFWLRTKYPREFERVFKWAQKPENYLTVLDEVYASDAA